MFARPISGLPEIGILKCAGRAGPTCVTPHSLVMTIHRPAGIVGAIGLPVAAIVSAGQFVLGD